GWMDGGSGFGVVWVARQPVQRGFERLEPLAQPGHLLLHGRRLAEAPDEALNALLELTDARGHGVFAGLERLLAGTDEVVQEAGRKETPAAAQLGDDLREHRHRHVLA